MNGYFSAVRKGYKSAFSQIFELLVKIITTIILLTYYANKSIETICSIYIETIYYSC